MFPGPKFNRVQLEGLAGSKISDWFGPLFKAQDGYRRQVRMPEPPLLLADRVLGINAVAGSMEPRGSIWTETDVVEDAWYVHHGHMPAGLMVEAGQADLLLISWLGADFENRGERIYRLLGCELTYRGPLPEVGSTLRYDIHLDGYAKQGDVRLFFFHYNCEIDGVTHLEVRHGQAGFFTDAELAASAGVIWDPAKEAPIDDYRPIELPCRSQHATFSNDQVAAFTKGDLVTCFGGSFYPANCHQRTPTIAGGRLLMFDEVLELDHEGGPWRRGYAKAQLTVAPDHWFFDGHFKNDPCMPGTLMLEGGIQLLSFYLASMGFTLDCDGWRFEPVKDQTFNLSCRSQLVPGNQILTYEVFVHGVECDPNPQLRADLLCSVDGRKAFLGRGLAIGLVPGWPLESRQRLLSSSQAPTVVAGEDLFQFDQKSMVACAWGKPSMAFGPHYARYDGPGRGPRLPGYPYHFISRVVDVDIHPRRNQPGGTARTEYDIRPDDWYFSENSQASMPFPVLLEAALQPCGWLSTYMGGGFGVESEVFFRNLDGRGRQHLEVLPTHNLLTTEVKNTRLTVLGDMTIVGFSVQTFADGELAYELDTVFGFFPAQSLAQQSGLTASEAEKEELIQVAPQSMSLRHRPVTYFNRSLRLPGPMLCLLDDISGYWPDGGSARLGRVRAEMAVDSNAWFFKSHFYGDPVQPGSLGLEMMLQCLQFAAIEGDFGNELESPSFATTDSEVEHSWSYRGQVLPQNQRVTCDLEISAVESCGHRVVLRGNASLWVDGQKIYQANGLAVSIVAQRKKCQLVQRAGDTLFDTRIDTWINDHCPTYTIPVLPFTVLADLIAATARVRVPGRILTGLRDVRVQQWVRFDEVQKSIRCWGVSRSAWKFDAYLAQWDTVSNQYQEVAAGQVVLAEEYPFPPKPFAPISDQRIVENIYQASGLFHGPAFQALIELQTSAQGATGWIDLEAVAVPRGEIHPGLLDACLHVIPHDDLQYWFPELPMDHAAYPLLIEKANFYAPTPSSGRYRVEARPLGIDQKLKLPRIAVQVISEDNQVWAELNLIEILLPKGPLGRLGAQERRQFLQQRIHTSGVSLSSTTPSGARLTEAMVRQSNWLKGTLAAIYDSDASEIQDLTRSILTKEVLSQRWQVHPSRVGLGASAHPATIEPNCSINAYSLDDLSVAARIDLQLVAKDEYECHAVSEISVFDHIRDFWRLRLDAENGLAEDILLALTQKFTGKISAQSQSAIGYSGLSAKSEDANRGVLYVANHQVGVESVLFSIVMSAFRGRPIFALAKQEHRDSWIGRLLQVLFADRASNPGLLRLIDRDDPAAVLRSMKESMQQLACGTHSMLVHVAGTRALGAREEQTTVSSALVDAAVAAGIDIVPVRFYGGLPLVDAAQRLEFPTGFGCQHWWLGKPIRAHELRGLSSTAQRDQILHALNTVGNLLRDEMPSVPDSEFGRQVNWHIAQRNCTEPQAVLRQCLLQTSLPLSADGAALVNLLSGFSNNKVEQNESDLGRLRHLVDDVFGGE